MHVESVSAVLFSSPEPSRLADFYKTRLGIPFERDEHGHMGEHLEADLGDVHLAVLKGRGPAPEGGGMAATFRVKHLDRFVEELRGVGTEPLRPVIDLGEGMRVASFRDPDGNAFNLIELAGPGAPAVPR